jgi:aspartate racemase
MNLLKNKNIICGIIGGVGPMAGLKLHEKIIINTITNGSDQDHLNIHHISQSSNISDRTDFLLSENKINPSNGAFIAFKSLLNSIPNNNLLIIGVPCNTFHSDKIWINFVNSINIYSKSIVTKKINCHILNMIDETVNYILSSNKNIKKIGIMSTEGTKKTKVYDNKLKKHNIDVIYVPDYLQNKLTQSIYNKDWGIKSISYPITDKAKNNLIECANWLCNNNSDVIILGCTEIPIGLPSNKSYSKYNIQLVDPVEVLAKSFIRVANEYPNIN